MNESPFIKMSPLDWHNFNEEFITDRLRWERDAARQRWKPRTSKSRRIKTLGKRWRYMLALFSQ